MGESEPIIRVEGLGKKYLLSHRPEGRGRYQSLREMLMNGLRAAGRRLVHPFAPTERPGKEEFWALKDVSFAVRRGEVVGIIGRGVTKTLDVIFEEIHLAGRQESLAGSAAGVSGEASP